jgi:hypothetical protein
MFILFMNNNINMSDNSTISSGSSISSYDEDELILIDSIDNSNNNSPLNNSINISGSLYFNDDINSSFNSNLNDEEIENNDEEIENNDEEIENNDEEIENSDEEIVNNSHNILFPINQNLLNQINNANNISGSLYFNYNNNSSFNSNLNNEEIENNDEEMENNIINNSRIILFPINQNLLNQINNANNANNTNNTNNANNTNNTNNTNTNAEHMYIQTINNRVENIINLALNELTDEIEYEENDFDEINNKFISELTVQIDENKIIFNTIRHMYVNIEDVTDENYKNVTMLILKYTEQYNLLFNKNYDVVLSSINKILYEFIRHDMIIDRIISIMNGFTNNNADIKQVIEEKTFNEIKQMKFNELDNIVQENNNKCSICCSNFDLDDDVKILKCNHIFHTECIKKWLLEYSHKCPYCKQSFEKYVNKNGNEIINDNIDTNDTDNTNNINTDNTNNTNTLNLDDIE